MGFIVMDELYKETVTPKYSTAYGELVTGSQVEVGRLRFEKGYGAVEHAHPQEQVLIVLEGMTLVSLTSVPVQLTQSVIPIGAALFMLCEAVSLPAYWRRMRRRAALGLGDPLVTNRFGLWALASATGVVCLLTSVPPLYLPAGSALLLADLVVFGAAGVATASLYWLAFFPPARYRSWASRVPATEAA